MSASDEGASARAGHRGSADALRLIWDAFGLALRLPLVMRRSGLRGLEDLIRAASPTGRVVGLPPEAILDRSGGVLDRLPWRPSCLVRASVQACLLRRAGHRARVVIGADLRDGDVASHAWISLDDREIGREASDGRAYVAMWRIPS